MYRIIYNELLHNKLSVKRKILGTPNTVQPDLAKSYIMDRLHNERI